MRPYRDLDSERVYRTGVRAWEAGDRVAWGACVEELRRRRSAKALEFADRLRTHDVGGALLRGSREALCDVARGVARGFPRGGRGRHAVYVVLLHGAPGSPEWGFYVGMTGRTPEARYREHLAGERDGKGFVRDYAVELLPDVYGHLNPMPIRVAEAREHELAEALRAAGLFVRGGH
ncbi:MAG: hypothetical protein U0324_07415 [Polyangiales bacterium]